MSLTSTASPHEHIIHLSWAYLYSAALNAVAELGPATSRTRESSSTC
ncbi:hypothetical protein [Sorangium sp. So ce1335]